MRLQGKVAAITGAGSGIGRAAAELFAAEGAAVAILEVDAARGEEVQRIITRQGGKARAFVVDIASESSVQDTFAEIDRHWGILHVLYNNASIFLGDHDSAVADLSSDIWKKVLSVNLDGLFHCCKHALPLLLKSGGGSIINTASSAGVIGVPGLDAYTASKGATVSLTRSMAVEYGPQKVRVNCIAPAAIHTPMLQSSNPSGPKFDEAHFLGLRTPLRRYGTPEEVARTALFLASDDSSYINGAIIVADGGITINGDLSRLSPPASDR